MKKLSTFIIALLLPMMAAAQCWPANYGGVMLQGFWWDSFQESKWTVLEEQADELSQYFDLIWIPNSGQTKEDQWNAPGNWGYENMGYSPVYWLKHNTCFGTEYELRSMINTYKDKGVGIIEDVVVNHKNGLTNWADFPNETRTTSTGTYTITWSQDMTDLWGICKNDEIFTSGSPLGYHDGTQYWYGSDAHDDERDNFDGCRDLDHVDARVQNNIKTYLDFLIKDLGYVGFRYDMVKGFAGYYVGMYNTSAKPQFSVGEYWDNYDATTAWIGNTTEYSNGAGQSAAFDFPLKFIFNDVFNNNNWTDFGYAGMAAADNYKRWSVTFVDNHDTYRDNSKLSSNVLAANAFILAMPGTPCIFLRHWYDYKPQLKKMILARKAAGITNTSEVKSHYYQDGGYVTIVQGTNGKVLVTSGFPQNVDLTGYKCVVSGDETNPNFAYYVSDNVTVDEPDEVLPENITIYVRTTVNDAHLYAWDKDGNNFGNWPGEAVSSLPKKTIDGQEWHYRTYDVGKLNVILNNGNGTQTGDITSLTADHFFEYSGGTTATDVTSAHVYQSDMTVEEGKVYAYFERPAGWGSDIKVWAWNNTEDFTGGNWPGQSATLVGTATNGNEIWKWVCGNDNATPTAIVFNCNNGTNQTSDLPFTNGGYYTVDGLLTTAEANAQKAEVFNREFTADVRSTVCLPFSLSAADMQQLKGTAYELTDYEDGYLRFTSVESMEAFKPYLLVARESGKILAPFSSKVVEEGYGDAVDAGPNHEISFIGTTEAMTLISDNMTTYYGYSNNQFVKAGDSNGVKILPYRAYFATDAASGAKLNGTLFDDEAVPTAIEIVPNRAERPAAAIYNLNGQRVDISNFKVQNSKLAKGVYIIGNRKVVVK